MQCIVNQPLVHRRCAAHRVMPVDVPVHLILGEQQRLERTQPLLEDADAVQTGVWIRHDDDAVEQAVDIDLAVWHTAHHRIALQVVDLVDVDGSRDEPLKRSGIRAMHECEHTCWRVGTERRREGIGDGARGDAWRSGALVIERANLLERVAEGIVTHVVEQHRHARQLALARIDTGQFPALHQQCDRAPRHVMRPERMLEPRMRGARINEECVAELSDVAQPLHRRRIHQGQCQRVEPDVVPERIADDFHCQSPGIENEGVRKPDALAKDTVDAVRVSLADRRW